MKEHSRLNYLHYGDALSLLRRHAREQSPELILKSDFLLDTFNGSAGNIFLKTVLNSYGDPRSKKLCPHSLIQDVHDSHSAQHMFRTLGCRGFSHAYVTQIAGFPYRLRRQIDLRAAILSCRDIFYPKRVRRFLQRHAANHCFVDAYPAIAFALGRTIGRNWYIAIIQSDIAFSTASYVREHFRGWRKVLFASILRHAADEAKAVYLCPSSAIMEGTFLHDMKPEKMPETWTHIYDCTARDFGMKLVTLPRAVDMQIYSRKQPVYCRSFYELKMTRAVRNRLLSLYGNRWQY